MRASALLLLWLAPLAAQVAVPPRPGLYATATETRATRFLGPYRFPTADCENRLLYAVDAAGKVVRWRFDELGGVPWTYAQAAEGEPPYAYPLAAPAGGLVAVAQVYPVPNAWKPEYQRVALSILDAEGRRIAGPLPLCRAELVARPGLPAAWHPRGGSLAFFITEGDPLPGLYVMEAKTRKWVLADRLTGPPPQPLPTLLWHPGGRLLSLLYGGELVLRGGGAYAVYRHWPAVAAAHCWLDADTIALLDPTTGITLRGLDGGDLGRIDAWRATSADELSLPSSNKHGTAWFGPPPADARRLALQFRPKTTAEVGSLLDFPRGEQPYGSTAARPIWLGDDATIVYEVPGG